MYVYVRLYVCVCMCVYTITVLSVTPDGGRGIRVVGLFMGMDDQHRSTNEKGLIGRFDMIRVPTVCSRRRRWS